MNKYEIIGIVGEGAYGIVYKAKCKETGEFGKSIDPVRQAAQSRYSKQNCASKNRQKFHSKLAVSEEQLQLYCTRSVTRNGKLSLLLCLVCCCSLNSEAALQ